MAAREQSSLVVESVQSGSQRQSALKTATETVSSQVVPATLGAKNLKRAMPTWKIFDLDARLQPSQKFPRVKLCPFYSYLDFEMKLFYIISVFSLLVKTASSQLPACEPQYYRY